MCHEEVAPPPATVADVHRHPRQDFMLDPGAELPVPVADAPAFLHGRVHLRTWRLLPPVQIGPRLALTVRRGVHQVAVGDKIPTTRVADREGRVAPAPAGGLDERHGRVVDGVDVAVERRLQVLAEADLQRGLAIAGQVVGAAHARRDVVVAAHALRAREGERRPKAVRLDDAVFAYGAEAADMLIPQAALEREPAARPLVLDEE